MARCIVCSSDDGEWHDNDNQPLCPTCRKAPRFRYFSLCRPPGYAAIPDNWVDYEAWLPQQVIPNTERRALGWVEYTISLDWEQVWHWDLYPDGAEAQAEYWDWRDENNC